MADVDGVSTTTLGPPCPFVQGEETEYLICLRVGCQDARPRILNCDEMVINRGLDCQTDMHTITPGIRPNHLTLNYFCQASCPCGSVLAEERAFVQAGIDAELQRDGAAVANQFLQEQISFMIALSVGFFCVGIVFRSIYKLFCKPLIRYYVFRHDGHAVTKDDTFCRRHWLRITIFTTIFVSCGVAMTVAGLAAQDAIKTVGEMNGNLLNNFVTEVSEGILGQLVGGNDSSVPWPLHLSNPSTADMHIQTLTGTVSIYSVAVASVRSEDQVQLAPAEEGTLLVILEEHNRLFGGLLAVLTLYMADLMRVEVSLTLGGLFAGETFDMAATLNVPFNTSRFPQEFDADQWSQSLGYNGGIVVKEAMLDGLRLYGRTGEVMMQYETMSVDGGVTESGTASIGALRAVVAILAWAVGELLAELLWLWCTRTKSGRSRGRATTGGMTDSMEIRQLGRAQMKREGIDSNGVLHLEQQHLNDHQVGAPRPLNGAPISGVPMSSAPGSSMPYGGAPPGMPMSTVPQSSAAPFGRGAPQSCAPASTYGLPPGPPRQGPPQSCAPPASSYGAAGPPHLQQPQSQWQQQQQPQQQWQQHQQQQQQWQPQSQAQQQWQPQSQAPMYGAGSGSGQRRSGFAMKGWGGGAAPQQRPNRVPNATE